MTNPTPAKREESVGVVGRKKIAVASVLTAWPSLAPTPQEEEEVGGWQ